MTKRALRCFIIAGEESGDALGGKLLHALQKDGAVELAGIGGNAMQEQGLESLFPMEELSLLGYAEILPHIPQLLRRISETVEAIMAFAPDVVVTIDAPAFTLRVLRKLAKRLPPERLPKRVHMVAPSVWAYKPKRAKRLAPLVDHLLALLPFEPPYFQKEGIPTSFIGHPVVEDGWGEGSATMFRETYDVQGQVRLLAMMPGSRSRELKRHLPVFQAVVSRLAAEIPMLEVVMPVTVRHEEALRAAVAKWPVKVHLVQGAGAKKDALAASDAALVKSGTSTLQVALAGVPMVVAYRLHMISAWLLRRMIKIDTVTILNVIAGRHIIPECLQENCTSDVICRHLKPLLLKEEARREQLDAVHQALVAMGAEGKKTPSQRAAAVIWDLCPDKVNAEKA